VRNTLGAWSLSLVGQSSYASINLAVILSCLSEVRGTLQVAARGLSFHEIAAAADVTSIFS
jgi:hypothetical protein